MRTKYSDAVTFPIYLKMHIKGDFFYSTLILFTALLSFYNNGKLNFEVNCVHIALSLKTYLRNRKKMGFEVLH